MAGITIAPPTPRPPRGPYEVIAAELREQIQTGRLAPGDLVPTTTELAATHNVSIATSHRAIALLSAEGLIEALRGRRAVLRGPAVTDQPSQAS